MANSSTNLDLLSASQASKEVTANALLDAASPAMLYGRRASTSAALTFGYYGGTVMIGSTPTQISNGTVTLAATAPNYIEANPADGTVSVNQAGFTAGRTPLYSVVTDAATVTSYTDLRVLGGGVTSVTASNGVRTATGSAITSSDTIEGDLPINAQTGTSYTVVTGDRGKAVTFNNASPVAVSIAAAGSTGFPSGWYAELVNLGNGVVTLTPTTSTVDGAASITLAIHDNICLVSDGANYFTLRGRISGAGTGTVTSVALSTPGVLYNVSGSPVTSSGTLALSLINQAVNSVLAGPASGSAGAPSFRALGIGDLSFTDTDTALAANSDTRLATQKAVKAYIDNTVTGGAAGVMVFKGSIDCSTNPNYPAANAGAVYKVSVAGRLGGASGAVVEVGDTAYCVAASASGDQATVGSNWNVVQENIDGGVVGPTSATDGHVALFNGTTGKLIKDSGLTLAGTNTGDETVTTIGALVHNATAKAALVDADEMDLTDSAASFVMKKITWANIKATLKSYFDSLYAPLSQPFDLTAFYPGVPSASAIVTRVPVARTVSFPANLAGSQAIARVAATASTTFDVRKNGASFGSITFAAGAAVGTFTASATSLAGGDYLSIYAPSTADATLADIGFVLAGTR